MCLNISYLQFKVNHKLFYFNSTIGHYPLKEFGKSPWRITVEIYTTNNAHTCICFSTSMWTCLMSGGSSCYWLVLHTTKLLYRTM